MITNSFPINGWKKHLRIHPLMWLKFPPFGLWKNINWIHPFWCWKQGKGNSSQIHKWRLRWAVMAMTILINSTQATKAYFWSYSNLGICVKPCATILAFCQIISPPASYLFAYTHFKPMTCWSFSWGTDLNTVLLHNLHFLFHGTLPQIQTFLHLHITP